MGGKSSWGSRESARQVGRGPVRPRVRSSRYDSRSGPGPRIAGGPGRRPAAPEDEERPDPCRPAARDERSSSGGSATPTSTFSGPGARTRSPGRGSPASRRIPGPPIRGCSPASWRDSTRGSGWRSTCPGSPNLPAPGWSWARSRGSTGRGVASSWPGARRCPSTPSPSGSAPSRPDRGSSGPMRPWRSSRCRASSTGSTGGSGPSASTPGADRSASRSSAAARGDPRSRSACQHTSGRPWATDPWP